jgi:hypothetical protein
MVATSSSSDKHRAVVASVIAKAWNDPAYKAALLKDPKSALAEAGLTLPATLQVKAVENTATLKHVVLPHADVVAKDPASAAKLVAALSPIPPGVQVQVSQDSPTSATLVVPVQPPGTPSQGSLTPTHAATAMAAGWEAVNLYTTANAVGEANAVGVSNAVGASNVAGAAEGVVVAVGAAVLT